MIFCNLLNALSQIALGAGLTGLFELLGALEILDGCEIG
jgi:hypothetical protein